MNKKDRVAVVVSMPLLFISVILLTSSANEQLMGFLIAVPLFCYWGYRFIQNDLSFFKFKND